MAFKSSISEGLALHIYHTDAEEGLLPPDIFCRDDHSRFTSKGSSFLNNSEQGRESPDDGLSLCQTILPLLFKDNMTGEMKVENILLSEIL